MVQVIKQLPEIYELISNAVFITQISDLVINVL